MAKLTVVIRVAIVTSLFAIILTCWVVDRQRLVQRIAELESKATKQETLQDPHEVKLYDELQIGDDIDAHPGIEFLADDVIQRGHSAFDYCTGFLAEHFADVSDHFNDCEIYVLDVAWDVVPFRAGSYWIVARNNSILLLFKYESTIGG